MVLFLHLESPKREKLSILAKIKRLAALGIIFLIPSMVCLILALQWGGTTYSWSSPTTIGILVTFAVLFLSFVLVEVLTPETAMAPTRLILNRSIAPSMIFVFLLSEVSCSSSITLRSGFNPRKVIRPFMPESVPFHWPYPCLL